MVGRYGVRRYRLIIYPAGTTTADRRLARLWRGWPISGAVLGLLAVMLLGNVAASPDAVLAFAVAAYVSIGALLFLRAGPARVRVQVHVDRPHAESRRRSRATQVHRMAKPGPHADPGRPACWPPVRSHRSSMRPPGGKLTTVSRRSPMSNALSQIPMAVAAASILLTVYYLGRQGPGQSRSESWPGRRQPHSVRLKRR